MALGSRLACIDLEVKWSEVKVTWLWSYRTSVHVDVAAYVL